MRQQNSAMISFAVIAFALFLTACVSSSSATNDGNSSSRNEAALQTARAGIEKFRKGDAQIKITDSNGKPVKAAKLKITQTAHDFKFGCYLKIDDLGEGKLTAYERDFQKLFNYAAVGTYWDFIETEKGIENWYWFERETSLAEKLNAKIEAAPVLWGTNEAGTPKWLPRDKSELDNLLLQRTRNILRKYSGTVTDWEIVNEPLAPKNDFFARFGGSDYIEKAFRAARETAPDARLLINEYGVFGTLAKHNYNRDKYLDLLTNLREKSVPLDVVGIQAHSNGEWFAPADVAEQLNRYAALGLPLQITEFSVQTLDFDDRKTPLEIAGAYRKGIWDAEKQAEFYREFYTVAFGNPQVEAITTWGLDDERGWLPGIGLIDVSGEPKPNYKMLDQLINHEWRTRFAAQTKTDGTLDFRGFFGSYEIEVVVGGKVFKENFELKKNERNEWNLIVQK